MKTDSVQIAIIGAGVVGCAIAARLSLRGLAPLVLESAARIGEGISSRNSGVLHAGLYYEPTSLKTKTCIEGAFLAKEWCRKYNVHYRPTGKWIVGSRRDLTALEHLHQNALKSGVSDVSVLTNKEIERARELGIEVEIGLNSPSTCIIDAAEFTQSLAWIAEQNGSTVAVQSRVENVERSTNGNWILKTTRGEIESEVVVNCAGLNSDLLAQSVPYRFIPKIYPWRGDYFRVKKKISIPTLIYPLKREDDRGLGVHLTVDLAGQYRLGPDVFKAIDRQDFADPHGSVLENKQNLFLSLAQRYLPDLKYSDLEYDSCGIRPKLRAPGEKQERDFHIHEDAPGWINCIGIESPGLTASLAIGRHVEKMVSS